MNQDYKEYLMSPEWKERRNARLDYDNHKCRICGKKAWIVHHLTYERIFNEDPDDLASLCQSCHETVHAWQKKTKQRRLPSINELFDFVVANFGTRRR
jgi:5-methylcytosine-specific restriction endonuclease McrA